MQLTMVAARVTEQDLMLKKAQILIAKQDKEMKTYKHNTSIEKQRNRRLSRQEIIVVKKKHREDIAYMENELTILKEAVSTSIVVVKKNHKQYDTPIRMCLYKCLLCNVGVKHCSPIIEFVGRVLFDKILSSAPHYTVVADMPYEIGVLSDIMTGQLLHKASVINLAWDATTLKGSHVNEVQLQSLFLIRGLKSLLLDMEVLAGSSTNDYFEHISSSLHDAMRRYSAFYKLSVVDVKNTVLKNIKSTMTDRAKVNHCIAQRLMKEFNMEITELNYHLHPLDGLVQCARKTLDTLDREWELSVGSGPIGCVVAALINSLSKMRHKDGAGSQAGFKTFLKQAGLKQGVIQRYVGNRLNILFHMSAVIFELKDTLLGYLQSKCDHKGMLKPAIISRLENPLVLVQLQVLGLYSKLLTGPWMQTIYGNKEQHCNLHPVTEGSFKMCQEFLKKVQTDPYHLISCVVDAFGNPLEQDDPFLKLRSIDSSVDHAFRQVVSCLTVAFIKKLDMQLARYLSGDLSEPTANLLVNCSSAPLHNMQAERILGMMDAMWRRAPNANIGFIDGKIKGIQNDMLAWLESLPEDERVCPLNFSVHEARCEMNLRALWKQATDDAKARGQLEIFNKYDMKMRKKIEEAIEAEIDAIIAETSSLSKLEKFSKLSSAELCLLELFLRSDPTLKGKVLHHVWNESGEKVAYMETVVTFKTKTVCKKVVHYVCLAWRKLGDTGAASLYDLPVSQLLVDYIVGDLMFVV